MEGLNEHRKPKRIELTFGCQEDFDSMSKTEKGQFCSACRKEVIDFRKMSLSEIQQIRGDQTEMCGMFLPEQIDPNLRPIELPKVRTWAFFSTILLSLNFGTATAQSTVDPKVEQSGGTSNAPNLTPAEAKEKIESGQHISLSKATTSEVESAGIATQETERSKKWYWSKRFPFVHRIHRRRYGSSVQGWDYNID